MAEDFLPVPPGRPDVPSARSIRTVMLATDVGSASDAATERAIAVAAQLGARLLVTSVVDPSPPREGGARTSVVQLRAGRQDAVRAIVRRARRQGIDATFLVWEGSPGAAILSAAQAEEADLIVVGTRGHGRVGRLLLGSVSDHVVRHATCPVLVVHNETERERRAA
jgi:nucleotide-binding universal stress UspA family protein